MLISESKFGQFYRLSLPCTNSIVLPADMFVSTADKPDLAKKVQERVYVLVIPWVVHLYVKICTSFSEWIILRTGGQPMA